MASYSWIYWQNLQNFPQSRHEAKNIEIIRSLIEFLRCNSLCPLIMKQLMDLFFLKKNNFWTAYIHRPGNNAFKLLNLPKSKRGRVPRFCEIHVSIGFSHKVLNQFCLQFLKGRLLVPWEIEDKVMQIFYGKTVDEDPAAGQRWRKEI